MVPFFLFYKYSFLPDDMKNVEIKLSGFSGGGGEMTIFNYCAAYHKSDFICLIASLTGVRIMPSKVFCCLMPPTELDKILLFT